MEAVLTLAIMAVPIVAICMVLLRREHRMRDSESWHERPHFVGEDDRASHRRRPGP